MKLRRAGYLCLLMGVCIMGCSAERTKEDKTVMQEEIRSETELRIEEETEGKEEEMESQIPEEEQAKRIVCWGDSLTYGQGGNGTTYPSVLEEKTGLEVITDGIKRKTG